MKSESHSSEGWKSWRVDLVGYCGTGNWAQLDQEKGHWKMTTCLHIVGKVNDNTCVQSTKNNAVCTLYCSRTVSYTHLDVYKRQIQA